MLRELPAELLFDHDTVKDLLSGTSLDEQRLQQQEAAAAGAALRRGWVAGGAGVCTIV